MYDLKELTCSVVGMNDAELWHHIREACRQNSYAWNAYEVLHSRQVRQTLHSKDDACTCGARSFVTYQDGSTVCSNVNAHRR